MKLAENMVILERRLRAFVVAPVATAVAILVGPASIGGIVAWVVAGIMLATSAVGYCPLWTVSHMNTLSKSDRSRGKEGAAPLGPAG